jgi:hypothetical protein
MAATRHVCEQGQALRWIKRLEELNGLVCTSMDASDVLRQLSNAVKYGISVLLQVDSYSSFSFVYIVA